VPQLAGSFCRFTQLPEQRLYPEVHETAHAPLVHVAEPFMGGAVQATQEAPPLPHWLDDWLA
jgi:hypothetical protein